MAATSLSARGTALHEFLRDGHRRLHQIQRRCPRGCAPSLDHHGGGGVLLVVLVVPEEDRLCQLRLPLEVDWDRGPHPVEGHAHELWWHAPSGDGLPRGDAAQARGVRGADDAHEDAVAGGLQARDDAAASVEQVLAGAVEEQVPPLADGRQKGLVVAKVGQAAVRVVVAAELRDEEVRVDVRVAARLGGRVVVAAEVREAVVQQHLRLSGAGRADGDDGDGRGGEGGGGKGDVLSERADPPEVEEGGRRRGE
mmetsp:Transcript_31403/g.93312  ORF Transcript_31403/g.93312 Transcript_31403/m.93312 type:complete len:253 (+) Transcript_31403:165-923(+)